MNCVLLFQIRNSNFVHLIFIHAFRFRISKVALVRTKVFRTFSEVNESQRDWEEKREIEIMRTTLNFPISPGAAQNELETN